MWHFTSIYIHTTHFGSHTEITLQDIPNQAYTLRLSVENVEREVERKNNHTWTPAGWSGPRPPRSSSRATSSRQWRLTVVLTGMCMIWERAVCWLITLAVGLPVRGLVVIVPPLATLPSYPFHYFYSSFPSPSLPHLPPHFLSFCTYFAVPDERLVFCTW